MSDIPSPERSGARLPWLNSGSSTSGGSAAGGWPAVTFDDMAWRGSAACRHEDPALFFPVGMTGSAADEIVEAKAVCHRCPVRLSCLRYALMTHQEFGVWGGYDEEERKELRRQWRRLGRPFPIVRVIPADQVPRVPQVDRAG